MSRSNLLFELQKIDLARDDQITDLSRVVAALQGNPELARAAKHVEDAEAELARIEPILRDRNLERDGVKEHVAREEQKLYGGIVKSPKELQSLELEVEALKRRLSELDDEVLEAMLARDEAAARLASAREHLRTTQEAAAAEQVELMQRKAELTARVRQLDADRLGLVERIDKADLDQYTRLRAAKNGRAVARIREGSCDACGMQLPRQDVARARNDASFVYCPGCGRILTE
jgi:predicted  nucleic acid-binding Zn-ribbon protein